MGTTIEGTGSRIHKFWVLGLGLRGGHGIARLLVWGHTKPALLYT